MKHSLAAAAHTPACCPQTGRTWIGLGRKAEPATEHHAWGGAAAAGAAARPRHAGGSVGSGGDSGRGGGRRRSRPPQAARDLYISAWLVAGSRWLIYCKPHRRLLLLVAGQPGGGCLLALGCEAEGVCCGRDIDEDGWQRGAGPCMGGTTPVAVSNGRNRRPAGRAGRIDMMRSQSVQAPAVASTCTHSPAAARAAAPHLCAAPALACRRSWSCAAPPSAATGARCQAPARTGWRRSRAAASPPAWSTWRSRTTAPSRRPHNPPARPCRRRAAVPSVQRLTRSCQAAIWPEGATGAGHPPAADWWREWCPAGLWRHSTRGTRCAPHLDSRGAVPPPRLAESATVGRTLGANRKAGTSRRPQQRRWRRSRAAGGEC